MLNKKDITELKNIYQKYNITELKDFINKQEKSREKRQKRGVDNIRIKRLEDPLYARTETYREKYTVAKWKKIKKLLKNEDISQAKNLFAKTKEILLKHKDIKYLHNFLKLFSVDELSLLK